MVRALALRQQSQDHTVAPCYVDLVHKGRLRVWADRRRRNIASVSRHVQDNWLKGVLHEERVDMGRYNKNHGEPLGPMHNLADNCDLAVMGSVLRIVHCARRNCLYSLLNTTNSKVSKIQNSFGAMPARSSGG